METGGDVGAYVRKYGVVSKKATTGLLEKKRQFLKTKEQNVRDRKHKFASNQFKILTFCGVRRKTE